MTKAYNLAEILAETCEKFFIEGLFKYWPILHPLNFQKNIGIGKLSGEFSIFTAGRI